MNLNKNIAAFLCFNALLFLIGYVIVQFVEWIDETVTVTIWHIPFYPIILIPIVIFNLVMITYALSKIDDKNK